MKEYELYIPVTYNDGSPVEDSKFEEIGELLLEHFGGVTFLPAKNEGRWRMGRVVYHDKIVIYRVLADDAKKARKFFKRLKTSLKSDLQQEEILIVEKDANLL